MRRYFGSARAVAAVLGALTAVLIGGVALVARQSGPVLRTIDVVGLPANMVVDEQVHRAFVYNLPVGNISVIDSRSGALLRTVTSIAATSGVNNASMVLYRRSHHLFVSSTTGNVYMLDARTGAVLRTIKMPDATPQQAVVDERSGRVFVGYDQARTLTVLDAQSGAILRDIPTCLGPAVLVLSPALRHLFAKCLDGYTDMLDVDSGRVLHTTTTISQWGSMVVDDVTHRVLSGDCTHNVTRVLDARTGILLGTGGFSVIATVDPHTGDVFGARQAARCGPVKGDILRLDGQTATVLRHTAVADNPLDVLVNPVTGHVLVASAGPIKPTGEPMGNGSLTVLDSSGAVVHTIDLGITPWQLASDASAGRLLVLNGYSAIGPCSCTVTVYTQGWWPATVSRLKGEFGWLPFSAPEPEPATHGSVTVLDLAQL